MAKKKDFLICVDSDGCAMDTMDMKHFQCFGPCMIEEWNLQQWRDPLLERWNQINLYSSSRGINRFKALLMILQEVHLQYRPVDGLEILKDWVENAASLSNDALEQAVGKTGGCFAPILEQALRWSKNVNSSIAALPEELKRAFPGAKEALEAAHPMANIAVVSSANRQAVEEEWKRCGLLSIVDEVCAQDSGSKSHCIQMLLQKGFDAGRTLMIGDAPGDLAAAKSAGVWFFPILVKKERESWEKFRREGLERLLSGTFGGEYQEALLREFTENLC